MRKKKARFFGYGFCIMFIFMLSSFNLAQASEPSRDAKISAIPKGGGIVFFGTKMLEPLKDFYVNRLGCELWLDQVTCALFRFGNMLFAFCESRKGDKEGLITFFFKSKEDVDEAYRVLEDIALSPPQENKKYSIYHFYAKDPEGRSIEFQYFLHSVDWDIKIK
jgi:hypothetical protein